MTNPLQSNLKSAVHPALSTRLGGSGIVQRMQLQGNRVLQLSLLQKKLPNPQPAVLETAALPIELLAYIFCSDVSLFTLCYAITLVTTPAPTVLPPSRIANRRPSSIAIGEINSATILISSPGITISTPAGSSTLPVTSVVRK